MNFLINDTKTASSGENKDTNITWRCCGGSQHLFISTSDALDVSVNVHSAQHVSLSRSGEGGGGRRERVV